MKTTSLLRMVAAALLGICSAATVEAYDVEVDGIYYNYNPDGKTVSVTVNNETPYSGEVTIPSSIVVDDKNYQVTAVEAIAFLGCSTVTSVNIPETVTEIIAQTFNSCSALAEVTLPNTLERIGNKAFYSCN
ncbi:MAG: leucine-rich repeat protein [Muribaculaceae bacterium]